MDRTTTAKDSPLTLRLEDRQKKRLAAAARKCGLPVSVLVRDALEKSLPGWEKKGLTLGNGS